MQRSKKVKHFAILDWNFYNPGHINTQYCCAVTCNWFRDERTMIIVSSLVTENHMVNSQGKAVRQHRVSFPAHYYHGILGSSFQYSQLIHKYPALSRFPFLKTVSSILFQIFGNKRSSSGFSEIINYPKLY